MWVIGKYLDCTEDANILTWVLLSTSTYCFRWGPVVRGALHVLTGTSEETRPSYARFLFQWSSWYFLISRQVLFVFNVPCLKHWLRGLCKKGDQCEFLHEYDMSKMPECYFYSRFSEWSLSGCNNDSHQPTRCLSQQRMPLSPHRPRGQGQGLSLVWQRYNCAFMSLLIQDIFFCQVFAGTVQTADTDMCEGCCASTTWQASARWDPSAPMLILDLNFLVQLTWILKWAKRCYLVPWSHSQFCSWLGCDHLPLLWRGRAQGVSLPQNASGSLFSLLLVSADFSSILAWYSPNLFLGIERPTSERARQNIHALHAEQLQNAPHGEQLFH